MTQLKIVVRPLTMADFAAVGALFKQMDEQHYQAMPDVFKPVSENTRPPEQIEKLINDETYLCLVAIVDEQICGAIFCHLAEIESLFHQAKRYVHVSELVVAEQFFGQGVAQALMAAAKQWAREQNMNQLNLNVYAFNERAIRFYEKEGFYPQKIIMWCDL